MTVDPTPLPTRQLGSGPSVGAVGLGCMGMSFAYGSAADRDDATSTAVIRTALDLGVTLLDTADVYGPYANERLIGRAVAGRRDEVTLVTKGGFVVPPNATNPHAIGRDGSPEHLRAAVDESLERLDTDHIDLYLLHRVDPDVPLEESWTALAEAVDAGKVRQIGLCEVSVEEAARAHAIHPVAAVQSELSVWNRDPLDELIPWLREHGGTFMAFAPLGRGYLTGALDQTSFDADDMRSTNPRFTAEAMAANRRIVATIEEVARLRDVPASQVAIAWVLAQGPHVVPIPGTKREKYLRSNAAAAHIALTQDELDRLDQVPETVGGRYAAGNMGPTPTAGDAAKAKRSS